MSIHDHVVDDRFDISTMAVGKIKSERKPSYDVYKVLYHYKLLQEYRQKKYGSTFDIFWKQFIQQTVDSANARKKQKQDKIKQEKKNIHIQWSDVVATYVAFHNTVQHENINVHPISKNREDAFRVMSDTSTHSQESIDKQLVAVDFFTDHLHSMRNLQNKKYIMNRYEKLKDPQQKVPSMFIPQGKKIVGMDTHNANSIIVNGRKKINTVCPYYNFNGGLSFFCKSDTGEKLYHIHSRKGYVILYEVHPGLMFENTTFTIDILSHPKSSMSGKRMTIMLGDEYHKKQTDMMISELTKSHLVLKKDAMSVDVIHSRWTFHTDLEEDRILYTSSITNDTVLYDPKNDICYTLENSTMIAYDKNKKQETFPKKTTIHIDTENVPQPTKILHGDIWSAIDAYSESFRKYKNGDPEQCRMLTDGRQIEPFSWSEQLWAKIKIEMIASMQAGGKQRYQPELYENKLKCVHYIFQHLEVVDEIIDTENSPIADHVEKYFQKVKDDTNTSNNIKQFMIHSQKNPAMLNFPDMLSPDKMLDMYIFMMSKHPVYLLLGSVHSPSYIAYTTKQNMARVLEITLNTTKQTIIDYGPKALAIGTTYLTNQFQIQVYSKPTDSIYKAMLLGATQIFFVNIFVNSYNLPEGISQFNGVVTSGKMMHGIFTQPNIRNDVRFVSFLLYTGILYYHLPPKAREKVDEVIGKAVGYVKTGIGAGIGGIGLLYMLSSFKPGLSIQNNTYKNNNKVRRKKKRRKT